MDSRDFSELISRELDDRLAALRCNDQAGFVYAVDDGSGLIKIGATDHIRTRLRALQLMNGHRVRLLGVSHDLYLEQVLHSRYAANRMHGEWFALDHNPLELRSGRCVSCRGVSQAEEAAMELARMDGRDRAAVTRRLQGFFERGTDDEDTLNKPPQKWDQLHRRCHGTGTDSDYSRALLRRSDPFARDVVSRR